MYRGGVDKKKKGKQDVQKKGGIMQRARFLFDWQHFGRSYRAGFTRG